MRNASKFVLLILAIALTSCGAIGTKTLYRMESNLNKPTKIGFSQVANEDIMEKIVKGSTKIYDSTMTNQLATQNIKSDKIIVEKFDEVEMQYYNANGNLLLHTKHNTHMGNSYWNFPSADKTVRDGTIGALGRIMKEITK